MVLDTFRLANDFTWDRANGIVFDDVIVNQGDANGRKMRVQVVNRGAVENITGAGLNLAWKAPNGKGLDKFTAVNAAQGIFEISFTKGMLANVGRINASLQLILPSGGGIVESRPFVISNQASVVDQDSAQSTDSWTALETTLANAEDLEANYTPKLFSLEQQLQQTGTDLSDRGYNIKWSELEVVDGDWTGVIQNALDFYKDILIPTGTFNVLGEIVPPQGSTVRFANGAKLLKPSTATNTEPVIWVKNSYVSILGSGFTNSFVESQVVSPFGVVCLGYKGMSDAEAKNIVYGTIKDIDIGGRIAGGETTGTPTSALYMCNPQIDNLPSYFHILQNLRIRNANDGISLVGWANANMFNNIHLYGIGNEKRLNGAAIHIKSAATKQPLDNIFSNVFHHSSSNAVTIYFEGGGTFNAFNNIVSEQGGTNARWIRQTGTTIPVNNVISGIDNVSGSSDYSTDFAKNNTIVNRTAMRNKTVITESLTATTSSLGSTTVKSLNDDFSISKTFQTPNLSENTRHGLLRLDLTNMKSKSIVVEFTAMTRGGTIGTFLRNGTLKIGVIINSAGTVTVTELHKSEYSAGFIIYKITGTILDLGVQTANNGTSTAYTVATTDYKIIGELNNLLITDITDNSVVIPV